MGVGHAHRFVLTRRVVRVVHARGWRAPPGDEHALLQCAADVMRRHGGRDALRQREDILSEVSGVDVVAI